MTLKHRTQVPHSNHDRSSTISKVEFWSSLFRQVLKGAAASVFVASMFGCKDRFQEGYDAGYEDGSLQSKLIGEKQCEERLEAEKRSCRNLGLSYGYSSGSSTEVCGGGGVNLNGKHYEAGKTGCVRVFSDGRVVRY